MSDCIACHTLEQQLSVDFAFIVGCAFGKAHNDEAIKRSLCSMHKTRLLINEAAASSRIMPEDRR